MCDSQDNINLTVLGLEITFKPGANMERARRAARFVEERFADQKLRTRGGQGKDTLLTFIVLGLADELLQMKNRQEDADRRIKNLLVKIESSL